MDSSGGLHVKVLPVHLWTPGASSAGTWCLVSPRSPQFYSSLLETDQQISVIDQRSSIINQPSSISAVPLISRGSQVLTWFVELESFSSQLLHQRHSLHWDGVTWTNQTHDHTDTLGLKTHQPSIVLLLLLLLLLTVHLHHLLLRRLRRHVTFCNFYFWSLKQNQPMKFNRDS